MSNKSGTRQRLLIVDDSKVIRVTARKILQDHFETVEAVDGENAWELLNNAGPFSLVVSDLTMPNLDGFGLLERIRSSNLPAIKDLPVIVITGANDSETTKERATSAGATDFIGKPFDSVHLLARTQAHASAHTTTQTLTEENIGLEDQALTDPLTDLANETAFLDRGYQQLSYAVRHKTSLAVFRIEIDDFCDLFKQHGKDVSDSIIKSVATVLQAGIRHEDMAARVGPARFTLLLPGMNTAGIRNLAERLNRDISARILKQGETRIRYTVSIGVAAPEIRRDTRFDELLSIADGRLVHAAAQGGNQVVFDGASVAAQTPPLQAATVEPAPVLADEAIAGIISQTVAAEIQNEATIMSTSAPQTEELTLEEVPAIEARAAQEPGDLPSMFAGPVPELMSVSGSDTVHAESTSAATSGPAVFSIGEDVAEDETIVITAPFDMHDPAEMPPAANSQPAVPATSQVKPEEVAPVTGVAQPDGSYAASTPDAASENPPVECGEPALEPRPGLFRRLFPFLFRRWWRRPG